MTMKPKAAVWQYFKEGPQLHGNVIFAWYLTSQMPQGCLNTSNVTKALTGQGT